MINIDSNIADKTPSEKPLTNSSIENVGPLMKP